MLVVLLLTRFESVMSLCSALMMILMWVDDWTVLCSQTNEKRAERVQLCDSIILQSNTQSALEIFIS